MKTFVFDDDDLNTLENILWDGALLFGDGCGYDGKAYFRYLKTLSPKERYEELKNCGSLKQPTEKNVLYIFWGQDDMDQHILQTYDRYFFIDEEDVISKAISFNQEVAND